MPYEFFSDFENVPWCQKLLSSPTYKRVTYTTRDDEWANSINPNLFRLFRKTLATPETVRACIALEKAATPSKPVESLLLISLGADLDGHPGTAHGGVVMLLMDELLGVAAEEAKGMNIFTAWLNTSFKKRMQIPCIVLGRSWCTEIVGRKLYVKGVLEDGEGGVYAEGESLFIQGRGEIPQPPKL